MTDWKTNKILEIGMALESCMCVFYFECMLLNMEFQCFDVYFSFIDITIFALFRHIAINFFFFISFDVFSFKLLRLN